jgi:hypothetical protein
MYSALDRVDLEARVGDSTIAVQTDHRDRAAIEAEPELSTLFAMARVLNARGRLADEGHDAADVRYVVTSDPPSLLRDALAAVGGTLERLDRGGAIESLGPASAVAVGELADRCFAALARRVGARVGSRDPAIALHVLEAETLASPPSRDDAHLYWRRVLELAALAGELLRARFAGAWVQTDRALVPFGFELGDRRDDPGRELVVFPTNRAQRVIDDGGDESLFPLLDAADEALHRTTDVRGGRLMPSLRARADVDLDEVVWRPIVTDDRASDLPVIVCGIDGESTFGMIRRAVLEREPADAVAEAIANLAHEPVERGTLDLDGEAIAIVSGSFYAAEKLLDRAFVRALHDELGARELVAATPSRGVLLVAARRDPRSVARFAAIAHAQHAGAGGRAISPAVWRVVDGAVVGCLP